MRSKHLITLATIALLATFWLFSVIDHPGTQFLAALGVGLTALLTVRLSVAAAVAAMSERTHERADR